MMTLVPCAPDRCPTCGAVLVEGTVTEPALVRHGGYGADRVTVDRACPSCGWYVVASVSEATP